MNISTQSTVPSVPIKQTAASPAPPQPAAPVTQATPAEALEVESKMGLLDYPKEGLLAVTKMAAKGQAKNIVEFADDLKDIKTAAKDFVQDAKKGNLLGALGNVGKMLGNAVSANVNAVQAGVAGLAAGASAVVASPFIALDYGAEAVGKVITDKRSDMGTGLVGGMVGGVGKAFQTLGGENSGGGLYDAVTEGQREGIQSAVADQ